MDLPAWQEDALSPMGPPSLTNRDEGDGLINLSYDEDWLAAQLERRRKRNLSRSTSPRRLPAFG